MKTINITTERGNFTAQLIGERGDWVVCWPGQFDDHEGLIEFALVLARDFRVVLCDPPAVGFNRNLPYSHSINDLAYFAQRLMYKLGIAKCHWVGHSAGGVVGAALCVAAHNRIQSLTLASTPMLSQGRFKLHAAASTTLLSASRLGRRVLVSRGIQELGYKDMQEKNLISTHLQKVFERTDPKTIGSMRPLDGASVRRIFDKLRLNPPPILVLCGRHDRIVLPRDQGTVAEITQSQFVDLPCGHMNLLAEPEACADAFLRFVPMIDTMRQPEPHALAA